MNVTLNPVLIGPCLGAYYSYRPKSKPIYVHLATGDTIGEFTWKSVENTILFFECLKIYHYEPIPQEVKLKNYNITLYISELIIERIKLVPNKALLQRYYCL